MIVEIFMVYGLEHQRLAKNHCACISVDEFIISVLHPGPDIELSRTLRWWQTTS